MSSVNDNNFRIYRKQNVLEAAKDRIRFVFDEFPNVVATTSGGKDSTIIVHLALEIAREKNRLPLRVMFIDQEAEWQATINQVRLIMERPDVEPMWMQIPIRLFNATSTTEHWLKCWNPDAEHRWMRPKEPYAYTENRYGTDRFAELFPAISRVEFAGQRMAYIGGVRVAESPTRAAGLTHQASYKWVTWGRVEHRKPEQIAFYPIYDWNITDVWKAIHDHGWPYNRLYDHQYAYGMPVEEMRVSNVHHETSVGSLFYMQEVEPDTWERLTQRIAGIDMAGKMGAADYFPKRLPFMFTSWREYRDHLLDKLITDPKWKADFRKAFDRQEAKYGEVGDILYKVHCKSILTNDWEHIKLANFERDRRAIRIRLRDKGLPYWGNIAGGKRG